MRFLPLTPESSPQVFVETASGQDRKSTRLNSSHQIISYAVFCLKKKKTKHESRQQLIKFHQEPLHDLVLRETNNSRLELWSPLPFNLPPHHTFILHHTSPDHYQH